MTSMLETLKMTVGRRWRLMATLFIFEIVAIIVVSNSAFFPGEQAVFQNVSNSLPPILKESAMGEVVSIFAQNFRVAINELIPVYGPTFLALSMYVEGRIIEVISISNGDGIGATLATLFLLPHTYLELPAYAIAVTESGYLLYAVATGFRRGWARLVREFRFLVVSVVLIVGVLIVAAIFEVTEIQIEMFTQAGPPIEGTLVFLTWIPFALVFAGALSFWRKARVEAPELEAREAEEERQQASALFDAGAQSPPLAGGEKDTASSPTPGEGGAT